MAHLIITVLVLSLALTFLIICHYSTISFINNKTFITSFKELISVYVILFTGIAFVIGSIVYLIVLLT